MNIVRKISDQNECRMFLMEHGMLDEIKPSSPDKPGCTGLFQLNSELTEFAIVDRTHDARPGRIGFVPNPQPHSN
jgi:hypothetical protein